LKINQVPLSSWPRKRTEI